MHLSFPALSWNIAVRRDCTTESSLVVVTTSKTDTCGRWLADITYLPGEEDPQVVLKKGAYLNRELLLQRLAVRYVG